MTIGENIRVIRKLKKLTQQQLADKLNISLMTVRRFETNARQPKLEMIDKIAVALGVEPFKLLYGRDSNFKISPEFIMGMMIGTAKKEATEKPEPDTTKQIESTAKYINKALDRVEYFSLSEMVMYMKALDELGNVCEQICKNHNWSIEND